MVADGWRRGVEERSSRPMSPKRLHLLTPFRCGRAGDAHLGSDMRDRAGMAAFYQSVSGFGREWGTGVGHISCGESCPPGARVAPGGQGIEVGV